MSFRTVEALLTAGAMPFALPAQSPSETPACPTAVANANPIRVPVTIVNNHVYVRVCIAGRDRNFILDTGAGGSILDLRAAADLGIRTQQHFRARGAGAGTIDAAFTDSTRIYIADGGSVVARMALDLSGVSLGEGVRIEGILGYDFIAGHVLAIDYANRELLLYDAKTFVYSGPGTAIPIVAMTRNHPHVRVDVLVGDSTRLPAVAVIDVGSAAALGITKPFADRYDIRARAGATIRTLAGGGVGGGAMADVGRVAGLQIGPYTVMRPIALMFGDSAGVFSTDSLWEVNVGGDILRRFKVWFDYGRKQMILEPLPTLNAPFEADMSGARVRAEGTLEHLVVAFVVAKSPAGEAGLEVNDEIVAIDGKAPTESSLRELRERTRRPGETVRLTVQRGTQRLDVQLTTRRLI